MLSSSTQLASLSVRLWLNKTDDISVIFAHPTFQDCQELFKDHNLSKLIEDILLNRESLPADPPGNSPVTGDDTRHCLTNCQLEAESSTDFSLEIKSEVKESSKDEFSSKKSYEEEVLPRAPSCDEQHENKSVDINTTSEEHIIKVDDKLFGCSLCTKQFSSRGNANKHLKLHGIGVDPVADRTCPHCAKVFPYIKGCRRHADTCKARSTPAQCPDCRAVLGSTAELREHRRTAHPDHRLRCSYCEYLAPSLQYRTVHEKKVHLQLGCRVCRRLFDTAEEKAGHVCVEPGRFQCGQCEKSYKLRAELNNHVEHIHRGRKHPCHICPDVLSSSQALRRHVRLVHETRLKNLHCHVCGKAFKDRQTLRNHERTHDAAAHRSDPCPQCGKVLSSKSALREHVKTVHDKTNFRHTCEDCGKCFPYLHTLQIHSEMAHLKGCLVVCQVCGKEMVGRHRLQNHMLTHPPDGETFVQCEHCGKDVLQTQLRSHIVESHKMQDYRYQCDFCPKRFDTKQHIRNHIRKHTGAKPYSCSACGNTYRDRQTVVNHIKNSHNGDLSLCQYDIGKDEGNAFAT